MYPWLLLADEFDLVRVCPATFEDARARLAAHTLAGAEDLEWLNRKRQKVTGPSLGGAGTVPLFQRRTWQVGVIRNDHEKDPSLRADILLEDFLTKASGALALRSALRLVGPDAGKTVDYVIGCSEEAVGDRYQRGGGNMGKAVAEMAGCRKSSGADVKNFCAAPIPAVVLGASLVAAGVFRTVAVVAGGSVPTLGMKFHGHLRHKAPILEDVVGGADVPARNYRMIGALAAQLGEIRPAEVEDFVRRCGLPGFAPTRGHIASAACYWGHARALPSKEPGRSVMLLAKGSLFLGRMTQLSDGMSVLLETNPRAGSSATAS